MMMMIISQGSVATCFRCGDIFNGRFIANLLMNVAVKSFDNGNIS